MKIPAMVRRLTSPGSQSTFSRHASIISLNLHTRSSLNCRLRDELGHGLGSGLGVATVLAALLEELRHKPGPSGLMAGADSRPIIAVEILVEKQVVPPMRIRLKFFRSAENSSPAVRIPEKDVDQTMRKLGGHLPERHEAAGTGRTLHLKFLPDVMMKFLKGFDQKEVDRHPDGAAPIGVAAEKTGGGFRRLIGDFVDVAL